MSFWERIVGPGTPASVSGIFGSLTGLFGEEPSSAAEGADPSAPKVADGVRAELGARHGISFTIAVVALGAKMAKADGRVTIDEVSAFKTVFTVDDKDLAHVGRVFDLARQDTAGFDAYASQLSREFAGNKMLLQDVLEGLFHIASADDFLHPAEDAFLAAVARHFGLTDSEFLYVRSHFVAASEPDPYQQLGTTPAASNTEVRAAYLALVRDNHPDRYIGRGLPKETIDIANRKLAAINQAYATIAAERGIK